MIGIYMLVSPSGRGYIGQSKNIERRISQHKNLKVTKQTAIYNSICKYKFENFKVEILQECKIEELSDLEKYYIDKYSTLSPDGYNLTSGGEGYVFTDEGKLNCRIGNIRQQKDMIHTYEEPIILFDGNFNMVAEYKNIEEAALCNNEKIQDIYYSSNCVTLNKIWILRNARSIDNVFGNWDCKLSEIYKVNYKDNYNKIEPYLQL